jgi:hypothetical protein
VVVIVMVSGWCVIRGIAGTGSGRNKEYDVVSTQKLPPSRALSHTPLTESPPAFSNADLNNVGVVVPPGGTGVASSHNAQARCRGWTCGVEFCSANSNACLRVCSDLSVNFRSAMMSGVWLLESYAMVMLWLSCLHTRELRVGRLAIIVDVDEGIRRPRFNSIRILQNLPDILAGHPREVLHVITNYVTPTIQFPGY